jgi:hypothetical protein
MERGGDIVPLQKTFVTGPYFIIRVSAICLFHMLALTDIATNLGRCCNSEQKDKYSSFRMSVAYVQLSKYRVYPYLSCIRGLCINKVVPVTGRGGS